MKVLCILACVLGAAWGWELLVTSDLLERSETILKLVKKTADSVADQVNNVDLSPHDKFVEKRLSLVFNFYSDLVVQYAVSDESYSVLYDRLLERLENQSQYEPAFVLAQPVLHLLQEFSAHTRRRAQALQQVCQYPVDKNPVDILCGRRLGSYDDNTQAKHRGHKKAAQLHDALLDHAYLLEEFYNVLQKIKLLKDEDDKVLLVFLSDIKEVSRKPVERLAYAFKALQEANENPVPLDLSPVRESVNETWHLPGWHVG